MMETVITYFITHKKKNQQAARQARCQSENVYERKTLVPQKAAKSDFYVISEHVAFFKLEIPWPVLRQHS
jgi:hypothetical protein